MRHGFVNRPAKKPAAFQVAKIDCLSRLISDNILKAIEIHKMPMSARGPSGITEFKKKQ
jgi:hypothetical protein